MRSVTVCLSDITVKITFLMEIKYRKQLKPFRWWTYMSTDLMAHLPWVPPSNYRYGVTEKDTVRYKPVMDDKARTRL